MKLIKNMSVEALAMAGLSCSECDIAFKEWEPHFLERPPEHLLLEGTEVNKGPEVKLVQVFDGELVKAEIRKWAKAVVSINECAAQFQESSLLSSDVNIKILKLR